MQKRFVLDTLENLHSNGRIFCHKFSVSYSLFCHLRPFWVLLPDLKSCDTCLCKLHENLTLMAEKLLKMQLIPSANLEQLVTSCCCTTSSKKCMYGSCSICKDLAISLTSDIDPKEPVSCKQWMTTSERKGWRNSVC